MSKSTAYLWTKDIELTAVQRNRLFKSKTSTWKNGLNCWIEQCREKRIAFQDQGRDEIELDSWEHAAGCMLWWAEGDKSKNQVAFTNTDQNMLRFFVEFLKKYYKVPDEKFSISFQYHQGNESEISKFWKEFLDLPSSKTKGQKKKSRSAKTKWVHGVARIRVNSTEIANRLWGSVQKYIGFDDPERFSRNVKDSA